MPSADHRGQCASRSRKRRIVFLNRSYWPDLEATGQLLTELCEDLASSYDVTVIAGPPNHTVKEVVFQQSGWSTRHGVKIRRVRCSRFPKAVWIGRAINYVCFVLAAFVAAMAIPRADILIVETDPPLLCFVGAAVQKLRGGKLVMYLQDIYPNLAFALGKLPKNFWTQWLQRAMFAMYRRADRVVVLSGDMRNLLVRCGIDEPQISCVPNWIDTRKLVPIKKRNPFVQRHDLIDRFVVMYSGNLGLCQRLEDVLEAARLLTHRDDIVFLLIGEGALKARLMAQAAADQLKNVRFLPYQPKEELSHSLGAAHLHLVPVDPRVVECLMPSKLYGVLASGTPVLAVAPRGSELAELVERHEIGIVSPPGEPAALAATIERLTGLPDRLKTWGHRARAVAEQFFDRRISTAAFTRVLRSVAEPAVSYRRNSTEVAESSMAVASESLSMESTIS